VAGVAPNKRRDALPMAEAEHRASSARVVHLRHRAISPRWVRPLVLRPRIAPGVLYRVTSVVAAPTGRAAGPHRCKCWTSTVDKSCSPTRFGGARIGMPSSDMPQAVERCGDVGDRPRPEVIIRTGKARNSRHAGSAPDGFFDDQHRGPATAECGHASSPRPNISWTLESRYRPAKPFGAGGEPNWEHLTRLSG